ncbi:MAG: glycosyltransferase family 39 protein [Candidatus Zixiibacteriota bacterium]|nr:MAG: glycosyltransferase family 39 protein [candidate division Zixibacteria bacterium]
MRRSHFSNIDFVLAAIMIAAAVVRVWGLDFGLPHPWSRPDESIVVYMAAAVGQGGLRPFFFNYPALYPFALAALFGLYYLLGRGFGWYSSVYDFVFEFATDPSGFFLIDRTLSAITGVMTVFVVYRIAKRLFDGRLATVAAAYLAFAYMHVRHSHFGVTDVPMTFMIMLSLLLVIRAWESGRTRDFAWSGLAVGLAVATKYPACFLVLPALVAHFQVSRGIRKNIPELFCHRRLLAFAACALAAFLVTNPYALIELPRFLDNVLIVLRQVDSPHLGVKLDRGWVYHFRFSLYYGLGWPLLAASLVGMIMAFRRDSRKALLLCTFPLVYYLVAGMGYSVFVRYIIPVVPFLCITAALATEQVARAIGRVSRRIPPWVVTLCVTTLILIPSLYRTIRVDDLLTRTDSRLLATARATDLMPPGASVYQTYAIVGALQLNPGQYFLERYRRNQVVADDQGSDGMTNTLTRLVDSLAAIQCFRLWSYDSTTGRFLLNGLEQDGLPDYIIAQQLPLRTCRVTPGAIQKLLAVSYRVRSEIPAFDTSADNHYDEQDHFYVPYAGFKGVERPGPNLFIYEKIETGRGDGDPNKNSRRADSNR